MDVPSLLVGAAIALASGLVVAVIQHVLLLRADRIKRERDKTEEELEELKILRAALKGKVSYSVDASGGQIGMVGDSSQIEGGITFDGEDQEEAARRPPAPDSEDV